MSDVALILLVLWADMTLRRIRRCFKCAPVMTLLLEHGQQKGVSAQAGTQLTCHSAGRLWRKRFFNVEGETPRGQIVFHTQH